MKTELISINLAEIADSDERFRISTENTESFSNLKDSVSEAGLVVPVSVCIRDKKTIPVCGFSRIKVLKELGKKHVQAYLIHGSDEFLLKVSIADNGNNRVLNTIEQFRVAKMLSVYVPDRIHLSVILSKLTGISFNQSYIKKLLKIGDLSEYIREGILEESIPLATAMELAKLETGDAEAMSGIFRNMKMSLSKQKEITGYSFEISKRDDISICELFDKKEVREILNDNELDGNRKTGLIRMILKKIRYPEISKKEFAFNNFLKQSALPTSIRITPPRDFEGLNWSCSFSFKDINEYQEALKKLSEFADNDTIKNLMES